MSSISLYTGSYPEPRLMLRRICREVVASLMRYDGYAFLEQGDFEKAVFQEASNDGEVAEKLIKVTQYTLSEPDLFECVRRLAQGIYSEKLYAGCRATRQAERERAYKEVERYCASRIFSVKVNKAVMSSVDMGMFIHDCLQDALLDIARSIDNIEKPRAFLKYIERVASRSFWRLYEAREKDTQHTVPPGDPDEEDPRDWDIGDILAEDIFKQLMVYLATPSIIRCLLKALDRLKPEYRWVYVLAVFRGDSTDVMTQILGITTVNLRVKLHHARQALRQDQKFRQCAEL